MFQNSIERSAALNALLSYHGKDAQFNQLVEECGELIVAIHHYKRGKASALDLLTELCDVRIMLDQLLGLFNEQTATAIDYNKITRELKRINSNLVKPE